MMKRIERGFTLVEVMISATLCLIGVTAIGVALDNGILISADNRGRQYALNALREEVEIVRDMDFDDFLAQSTSSTFTNAQLTKLRSGSGTRSMATTAMGTDIRKLTLSVSWTGRNNRTLTESLTTYVTRIGINRD